MAEEPNQIKSHIDNTRKELDVNLHELEYRVKEATDWHTYVNRYPWAVVGLAFAGGAALSLAMGSGRSRTRYYERGVHDVHIPGRTRNGDNKAAYVWDVVKSAVAGLAASQLKAFLNEAIPGFGQHYERAERQRQSSSHHMESGTVH